MYIAYDTLKQATHGFDDRKLDDGGTLIASGSFGHVFFGQWDGNEVAVKRLKEVIVIGFITMLYLYLLGLPVCLHGL